MEREGWPRSRIDEALAAARGADHRFDDGTVMGSMCTQPHDAALEAYSRFLPTNLGDPEHFPGTARLEHDVLADIADLTGAAGADYVRFLTGGTEANLLACYQAREATGKRDVVVSDAGHFSFEKAARLLGMRLVRVPCGEDLRSDPKALADAITDDTALVVAIAGSTELGLVDDVAAIAAAAHAAGVRCHVDGAFGGYVLPFMDGPAWDLGVPGVTSVALDPHKMGMAVVPAGALAVADAADWDRTAVETGYVSTKNQSTLMGTRPGAAAASVWAAHRALGRAGYEAVVATCLENARRLAAGLEAQGAKLIAQPELNVVTFQDGDAAATHAALAQAGFRLNVVPRFEALRIVVGPHVTADVVERFLAAHARLRVAP